VRVRIVLTGAIMSVLVNRCVWSQPFKPHLVIVVKAALVVVDEYRCGNVERIYKGQSPLSYTALVPLPVEAIAAVGRALSNHN
jgi:hypothetical protein